MSIGVISSLLQFFFPDQCIGCKAPGELICHTCMKSLIAHPEICPICHSFSPDFKVCTKCTSPELFYEGIIIGFSYSGLIKKLILALKYYHKYTVSDFLSEKLSLAIQCNPSLRDKKLVTTSIPSHWIRHYFQKGYNQSILLAQLLANKLGSDYISCTSKIRYTQKQTGLTRKVRLWNLHNAFVTNPLDPLTQMKLEDCEVVLIVDDIVTTGSTINEVARVIKSAYPHVCIWGLAVARSTS